MKFLRLALTTVAANLTLCSLIAQNLVPNPGFEDLSNAECLKEDAEDQSWSRMQCVEDWYIVLGLPDYVNLEYDQKADRYPVAKGGNAFLGMYLPSGRKGQAPSAIEIKLKAPLEAKVEYTLEFFVTQDRKHYPLPTDGLAVVISGDPLKDKLKGKKGFELLKELLNQEPQFIKPEGEVIRAREEWVKLSTTFIAEGGEQYLSVSNFRFDEDDLNQPAYYYFDEFFLLPTKAINNNYTFYELPPMPTEKESITLENVFFAMGSARLTDASSHELDAVVKQMKDNPEMKMEIHGHTDNQGNSESNHQLSVERAKSVYNYLVSKGISESRLTYQGHGDNDPIASNETEAGRAKNRRIELKVLE